MNHLKKASIFTLHDFEPQSNREQNLFHEKEEKPIQSNLSRVHCTVNMRQYWLHVKSVKKSSPFFNDWANTMSCANNSNLYSIVPLYLYFHDTGFIFFQLQLFQQVFLQLVNESCELFVRLTKNIVVNILGFLTKTNFETRRMKLNIFSWYSFLTDFLFHSIFFRCGQIDSEYGKYWCSGMG